MAFHWSLSDSKSPLVAGTLLSILAILNSLDGLHSSSNILSSSSFNNPLVTVLKASITIGRIVTFMFHSFFNSIARLRYLSFFSLFFNFILLLAGTGKSTVLQVHFFLLSIIIRSGRLDVIMWSACMSKSRRSLCVILQDICCVVYIPFVRMVKFNVLHISQWITLPTFTCLLL